MWLSSCQDGRNSHIRTRDMFLHELYISGPREIDSCDHFFDIAAPLIHDKLLEHLHCFDLVCHGRVLSSATTKMPVWFVAICIDFVHEDIGQILSNIQCDFCFSVQFIWPCFVPDVTRVVTEMRFRRRFSCCSIGTTHPFDKSAHVRSGIHSMWHFSCFTSRSAATGPERGLTISMYDRNTKGRSKAQFTQSFLSVHNCIVPIAPSL